MRKLNTGCVFMIQREFIKQSRGSFWNNNKNPNPNNNKEIIICIYIAQKTEHQNTHTQTDNRIRKFKIRTFRDLFLRDSTVVINRAAEKTQMGGTKPPCLLKWGPVPSLPAPHGLMVSSLKQRHWLSIDSCSRWSKWCALKSQPGSQSAAITRGC